MHRGKRKNKQQQKNIKIIKWLNGLGLKVPVPPPLPPSQKIKLFSNTVLKIN